MSAAFTGAGLDRAGDGRRRDAGWLTEQRRDPRALAVHAGSRGVLMYGHRLSFVPLAVSAAMVGACCSSSGSGRGWPTAR